MMGILLEHDPEKACLDPIRGGTGFRKRSAQTKQHDESDSTEPDHHPTMYGGAAFRESGHTSHSMTIV
jgi:hypothetical protein